MSSARLVAGTTVLVLIAAIALAGCGGSSSEAGETEASKSFLSAKGKNKIPTFGEEADADEREAASEVLEESLKARAAAEFEKQCATLTPSQIKQVEENSTSPKATCGENLERQAGLLSNTKAIRANTMTGPIDALRVKGDRGWALYHGKKGKDYAMAMEKVDDDWKVDALVTVEP